MHTPHQMDAETSKQILITPPKEIWMKTMHTPLSGGSWNFDYSRQGGSVAEWLERRKSEYEVLLLWGGSKVT